MIIKTSEAKKSAPGPQVSGASKVKPKRIKRASQSKGYHP